MFTRVILRGRLFYGQLALHRIAYIRDAILKCIECLTRNTIEIYLPPYIARRPIGGGAAGDGSPTLFTTPPVQHRGPSLFEHRAAPARRRSKRTSRLRVGDGARADSRAAEPTTELTERATRSMRARTLSAPSTASSVASF
ncbi:hypothetical protein EVAR_41319_1 [Eumeta japonica]|uniref:Uncharacterized protein n=1 Tax=Eumeta variegata TaxID=151549 RepID=A0A4C1X110_EUMVA|nr:hypothetical protein EVAR_41319_1 [Eumeta japonica]